MNLIVKNTMRLYSGALQDNVSIFSFIKYIIFIFTVYNFSSSKYCSPILIINPNLTL